MFRKLISSLSFSPALVGQLGFYARRLRKEEITRKTGLILTALALVVQSFAVFTPPEPANAVSANNFVSEGVAGVDEYLQLYDQNNRSLQDILSATGITREEIAATAATTYETTGKIVYSRLPHSSIDEGERALGYQKSDGSFGFIFGRPHDSINNPNETKPQQGWAGFSESAGWFAISKSSGNLVTERFLASNQSLPTIQYSKAARNLTQGSEDASLSFVHGGDKIQYRLTVTNSGSEPVELPVIDYLGDVLEYAQIVDTGGASFDAESRMLSWQNVSLQPGESQTRAFLVQLIDPVPSTSRALTDSSSYDCVMTNNFGDTIKLSVACPVAKTVESTIAGLPQANIGSNLAFSAVLLIVTVYFYARSRQLQKEIRIIRRDLNAGTI